jgi:predicted PurR-regulated permease PerM
MLGYLNISLDTLDVINSIVLLVVTSGFVYTLLNYLGRNVCKTGRLMQSAVLMLLAILFGSPFSFVLSLIELIIGLADYIAETNSTFAWLDPNLA